MNKVREYAYVNAKIRCRLSRLLAPPELDRWERFPDLASLLAGMSARVDFQVPEAEKALEVSGPDDALRLAETGLTDRFRSEIAGLAGFSGSDAVRTVGRGLMKSFEIGSLKKLLAAVFLGRRFEFGAADRIAGIPAEALLEFRDPDVLFSKLKNTGYAGPLAAGRAEFDRSGTMIGFESGLDRQYYVELRALGKKLSLDDAASLVRILGIVTDIRNLGILFRIRETGTEGPDPAALLIPFGQVYGRARDSRGRDPRDFLSFLGSREAGTAGQIAAEKDRFANLRLLDRLLEEILRQEIDSLLLRGPFSIGLFLAWYFLRDREIRAVISLLNARSYGPADTPRAGTG